MDSCRGDADQAAPVERFFGTLKYDPLYCHEIPNAQVLHEEVRAYRAIYNEIRPHEHLSWRTPSEAYLADSESDLFRA